MKATRPRLPRPGAVFTILVLIGFTLITLPFYAKELRPDDPTANAGQLSLAGWAFSDRPLEMAGEWEFYWDQFIESEKDRPISQTGVMPVPAIWNDQVTPSGEAYPISGVASYRLIIKDLAPGKYQIYIPALYVADRAWFDGRLESTNGILGRDAASMKTVWGQNTIHFDSDGGPHELILEIAAFEHRANGIEEPPLLAPEEIMEKDKQVATAKDMLFQAMLLLLAVYGFTIFFYRHEDVASLYFGMFCISFMFPTLAFGVNFLTAFWPDISFRSFISLIYLPGCLTPLFFMLYVTRLTRQESIRILNAAFGMFYLGMFAALAYLLYMGDTMIASQLFKYVSLSAFPLSAYLIYLVVRASLSGRDGTLLLLVGLLILTLTFLNDILLTTNVISYEESFGIGITGLGLLVFLLSQIVILAERWSKTLLASEQMTHDLSQLVEMSSAISTENNIEDLLNKIVHSAAEFLEAERGSLFIYDEETDELWSIVAEGLANKEIRISAGKGIAGSSFTNGKTINVKDAYKDERFIKGIDESTGFITRSILSMPVEGKNGRRLGVMQVLNKKRGSGFSELDVSRLRAFAAQAAISLENVELFSEMTNARNYNDSILSSMSSGVITISGRGMIEKLNQAALKILGGEPGKYLEQDAEDYFELDNSWLSAELALVRQEGQPRTLIDVDLMTTGREMKSINLSIVPLLLENENIGSLVLLDDITSEKRLKGTMSRFMTKEVADQVMNSDEDILSGASYKASVMFSDIRNFTGLSEKLGPRETVAILNEVFSRMVEEIFNRKGVLDKFIGDSIMAIYGAPITTDEDADHAVESAIAIKQTLENLNTLRLERNEDVIRVGIGIGTGEVIAGTIGSPKRMDYTVIGDSVNLAARLEALTKYYGVGIIICGETLFSMNRKPLYRDLDMIRVRGQTKPVQILQVLDYHTEETFPHIQEVLTNYARGLQYWRLGNWKAAASCFEAALEYHGDDRPSIIYLQRCRAFMKTPPAKDWDGVWDARTLGKSFKE